MVHPRRHMLAWCLGCFVPRFGAGGAASLLVTVALVGVLAAVAIPAYQDYVERTRLSTAYSSAVAVKDRVTDYVITNNQWPESAQMLDIDPSDLRDDVRNFEVGIYNDGIVGALVGSTESGAEKYIVLEPNVIDGELIWKCYGENIPEKLLPGDCR